jgi:signal transduction histidine kinase/CheY-like chemotaxis protein
MSALSFRDRLLLWALVPVYLLCLALHVAEVRRSGLAQLPVWAYAPAGSEFPVVGGYRVETDSRDSGLRPGDRLLRVGDRDLRGAGHIRFDALALEQTGVLGAALVFERDGVRRTGVLRPRPRPHPWTRTLPLVLGLVVCVLVLLRAPGTPDAQRFFAAIMSYGIVQAQFYGGPAWQTLASLAIWNLGTPIAAFLMLRWATLFPAEVASAARPWRGWAWLGASLWIPVRLSYFRGAPIPAAIVPSVFQALHALLMVGTVALLLRNYAHADPVGRRRLKWVLWGSVLGSLPLTAAQLALLFDPDWAGFQAAFAIGTAATSLALVCMLVAIVRYNVFDIDRLLSATASLALLGATFLAGALFVLPELARGLAGALGVGPSVARGLLFVALAGLLVPAHRRLRPWVDQLVFPERGLREQGVAQLLHDLAQCDRADEVLELVGERLQGVLGAVHSRVYAEREGLLEVRFARGPGPTPPLPARGAVALALARHPAPLRVGDRGFERVAGERSREESEALAALGAALLVPLRAGKDLAAVVALAPRRSGDVYTRSDLLLLETVAEKASSVLGQLRDAETIRSERVRADELARLRAAAEDALRRRSRFLAAASHDLRQPLHALRMQASLLGERRIGGETAALVERIQRSSDTLAEMFDALLDVSRLDSGAVEPRVTDVALDPLLEELVAELAPLAEQRGLALRWQPGGLAIRSDPVLLGRVLRNLLHNALRYTDDGEVRLAARRIAGSVEIEVSDSGPGIPPERREEIFREFVRLDPDDRRGGLGLGLSIVERLVRTLGHELELESGPGGGATFRVAVPAARPPPPSVATAGAGLEGRTVLVVDDDLEALAATRDVLTAWGCRVIAAATGDEALAFASRGRWPDAVLADYRLHAGRTGLELVEALRRAVGRPLPAAVLTGETGEAAIAALRSAGLPHLTKPVAPARLRALLAELLRRDRAERAPRGASRR